MQGWPEQPQGAPVLRDFDDPLDGHPRYEKIRWANPDKPNVQVALDRMRNRNVAVKFIERGYKITKHVRREILHHHSLLHENVIRFYDAFLTPNYLAIVMELGEMNLWQYVINRGGLLAEDEARDFFRQLIVGLDYCHSKGVANRDIKLENSILKTKYEGGKSTQIVKICDFGYCKSDYDSNATSLVGTSAYVAPEVIDATQKVYDAKAADIWSAGVVLYFMIEGRFPCGTEKTNGSIEALFKRICALELDHPEHMSTGPRELVAGIFRPSPNRVTIQQIMDHWWFKQDMPPHLKEQAVLVPEDGAPTEESLKEIIQQAELNEASLNTDRNIDELMVSLSHPLESVSSEVDKWFKDTPPQ